MTVLKAITITALAGLATFGFASASFATTPSEIVEGSAEAHEALVNEIRRYDVSIEVNPKDCPKKVSGFYAGAQRRLVICQDNGVAGGPAVAWTANDLDTLRHEAQHFIQDCRVGGNHDHSLIPVYRSPTKLAQETLGFEGVQEITTTYRAQGADDLTLLLEYEAFAVAARNIPLDQASDMRVVCGRNK